MENVLKYIIHSKMFCSFVANIHTGFLNGLTNFGFLKNQNKRVLEVPLIL